MTDHSGRSHRPPTRNTPRHRNRVPSRSRLRQVLVLTLVFLLSFAVSGATLAYNRLQGNINTHDISDLLGTDRPETEQHDDDPSTDDAYAGQTLNFLFMGTDSREGENADIDGSGTSEGMRADTTLLVQVPADRSGLTVVSIPRDTLVDIPSCTLPDGSASFPQYQTMFNSAFNLGSAGVSLAHGAACSIRTVEALTGVYIDDFVVVDFAGFIGLIDALGGVPMDVDEEINSREADLYLQPGCQILGGEDALGFARVRKGVGDGSDISRIGRQQDLLLAVIQDTLSTRVLTDPIRLYQVADQGTQTITTGQKIGSLPEIVGLAASMRNLDLGEVQFITMPFDWAGPRVVPNATYAPLVWEALRTRQAVDPRLSGPGWEIEERIIADEIAAAQEEAEQEVADPETDPTDGATEDPTDELTDTPSDESETPGATIAPTDEPAGSPTCTRETARS